MNILVTGASSGIGYALAKVLVLEYGANVIALARSEERLKALTVEVRGIESIGEIVPLVCDVSSELELMELVEKLDRMVDSLDILINNAGSLLNKPFRETSLKDYKSVYNVNIFGVVGVVQAAYDLLKKDGGGHIINISSMGGFQGSSKFSGLSAYSSSKSAVSNLTECLAEEMRDDGINVNCLALGAVQTDMLTRAFPDYKAPVDAEKMARYIANYCMNGANMMNGKIIPVALSTP